MTSLPTDPTAPPESATLAAVLEQSRDVKNRVHACAAELGAANAIVKETIAEGATELAADVALTNGERVESQVRQCADDLHDVNATLARGVANLMETELALERARTSLARTEVALEDARREEQVARHDAMHDSLTGLPNRAHFDSRLEQAIASAKRHGSTVAVLFFDLDGFKRINDTHGHAAGDGVLREVARRLALHRREEEAVCRNGGDEFLCFLLNPKGHSNIERIAREIIASVRKPIELDGLSIVVGVSIGISVFPANGSTGESLIRDADAAMYSAKREIARGWTLSETAQLDESPSRIDA